MNRIILDRLQRLKPTLRWQDASHDISSGIGWVRLCTGDGRPLLRLRGADELDRFGRLLADLIKADLLHEPFSASDLGITVRSTTRTLQLEVIGTALEISDDRDLVELYAWLMFVAGKHRPTPSYEGLTVWPGGMISYRAAGEQSIDVSLSQEEVARLAAALLVLADTGHGSAPLIVKTAGRDIELRPYEIDHNHALVLDGAQIKLDRISAVCLAAQLEPGERLVPPRSGAIER